ncbi:MAG: hypothetical protein WAL71_20740 [Terriglobales bacterium]
MAVLTFKFDESYKEKRSFMVGGWIANDHQWKRLQKRWQKAIAYENRTLGPDRQISRYHAAQMNANDGEFTGWEKEANRKLRLVRKLLKFVSSPAMTCVACGIDLKAMVEIFPTADESDAYVLCMKEIMVEIAHAMDDAKSEDRVAIIHDHGDWDEGALRGYNSLVDDPTWPRRHRFVSITPLTWREDVGLQSADLIAYELMRRLDDTLWTGRDMRKALETMLGMKASIYSHWIDKRGLEAIKELEDKRKGVA